MEEPERQSVDERDSLPLIRRVVARVQVSDWIASIAAFTAVISLVIALLGYRLAREQTALSRDQFEQTRSFWWLCSVDDDLVLTLTPSRNDAVLESVRIVFPRSLFQKNEDWTFKPKDLQLSLQEIHKRLMAIRASEVTFDKATGRYNLHAVRYQLPFIVESRYIVGGTMYGDRTLFFLRIKTRFSMGPTGVDNVKLESLSLSDAMLYGKLANDFEVTDKTLSKYWDVPADVIAQVAASGNVIMNSPFVPTKIERATLIYPSEKTQEGRRR